jgi:hypothetical protein
VYGCDALWREIDADAWERTANPWLILQDVPAERLDALSRDGRFLGQLGRIVEQHRRDLASANWLGQAHPYAELGAVAYFSLQFGFGEALPLYAGGLGVLAARNEMNATLASIVEHGSRPPRLRREPIGLTSLAEAYMRCRQAGDLLLVHRLAYAPHHEHGAGRRPHDVLRDRAKDDALEPRSPPRRDHDDVGSIVLRGSHDLEGSGPVQQKGVDGPGREVLRLCAPLL